MVSERKAVVPECLVLWGIPVESKQCLVIFYEVLKYREHGLAWFCCCVFPKGYPRLPSFVVPMGQPQLHHQGLRVRGRPKARHH